MNRKKFVKIISKFCYRNASSSSQLHPYVLSSPFSHRMEHIAPSWTPFNRESQNYMALGKSFTFIWQFDPHTVSRMYEFMMKKLKVNPLSISSDSYQII